MCSDSSLLLLRMPAQSSSHDSAPVALASCRQWRERLARAFLVRRHPDRSEAKWRDLQLSLRPLLLTFICTLVLFSVACGGKKPVTRTIPPPPPPPAEKPSTATTRPEKKFPETRETKEHDEETADDEFAEYKDAKPIWTQT